VRFGSGPATLAAPPEAADFAVRFQPRCGRGKVAVTMFPQKDFICQR
jgi:hypothetical protein